MIPLNNYVSKAIHSEKEEDTYYIITYGEIEKEFIDNFTEEFIQTILLRGIKKHPILNEFIVNNDDSLYLETDVALNLKDYYSISVNNNISVNNTINNTINNNIYTILNKHITTKKRWHAFFCIDRVNKEGYMYFKIDHSYVDGYQVKKILYSMFSDEKLEEEVFKRTPNTLFDKIYYLIVGTILLIIMCISFIYNTIFNTIYNTTKTKTKTITLRENDYLTCKSFDFDEIKTASKRNNITINDFLYALMIKTDYYYTGREKTIYTMSPISINNPISIDNPISINNNDTNNMIPLPLSIYNNYDNKTMFKKIHEMFNYCKYSLFIPSVAFIIKNTTRFIPYSSMRKIFKLGLENCNYDYIYTNVMAHNTMAHNTMAHNVIGPLVKNLRFLINTTREEICFNIISYDKCINITCTFKKGVITDKHRFEECIYKAYEELLQLQ